MNTASLEVYHDNAGPWEKALYAFLSEKHRRSGSLRTVQGYSSMLRHFFGAAGKPPDRVTAAEVAAWAHVPGLSGKAPSSTTVGARIACLSSFYRFLLRMDLVPTNACDRRERPKAWESTPRGLTAEDVQRLLVSFPRPRRASEIGPSS